MTILKCKEHGDLKHKDLIRLTFGEEKYILVCEQCLENWIAENKTNVGVWSSITCCAKEIEHSVKSSPQINNMDTIYIHIKSEKSYIKICEICFIEIIYEGIITSSFKKQKDNSNIKFKKEE